VDFVLLAAAEDGPRPFPEPVVAALRRVVACETVAYREWEKHGIRDRSFAPKSLDDRRAIWDEYPRFRCEDPNPSEMPSGGASTVASARSLAPSFCDADAQRGFLRRGNTVFRRPHCDRQGLFPC